MEVYVMVSFWLGVVAFVVRCLDMAISDWPKTQKPKTLGHMVADTLIGLGITVWAGLALWVMI